MWPPDLVCSARDSRWQPRWTSLWPGPEFRLRLHVSVGFSPFSLLTCTYCAIVFLSFACTPPALTNQDFFCGSFIKPSASLSLTCRWKRRRRLNWAFCMSRKVNPPLRNTRDSLKVKLESIWAVSFFNRSPIGLRGNSGCCDFHLCAAVFHLSVFSWCCFCCLCFIFTSFQTVLSVVWWPSQSFYIFSSFSGWCHLSVCTFLCLFRVSLWLFLCVMCWENSSSLLLTELCQRSICSADLWKPRVHAGFFCLSCASSQPDPQQKSTSSLS